MKVNGEILLDMEMVQKSFRMETFTWVISERVSMMELENTFGRMVLLSLANLKKVKNMEKVNGLWKILHLVKQKINQRRDPLFITVSSKWIISQDLEQWSGAQEEGMMDILHSIKGMARAKWFGEMEQPMRDNGKMDSEMGLEN